MIRKPVYSVIALGVVALVPLVIAGCMAPPLAPVESRLVAQSDALDRGYHVVQASETLYSIAFAYDLDFRTLARWNGIGADYRIFPGQRLKLSGPRLPSSTHERQSSDENVKISSSTVVSGTPEKPSVRPSKNPPTSRESDPSSASNRTVNHTGSAAAQPPKSAKSPVISSEIRTSPIADSGPIRWQWPVPGPVLARFSAQPTGNKGLNIAGKSGEPVKAAAAGRVVYAGNGLRGFGQLVIVKHDDDYLSAYAHNSRLHVKENDAVKAGQLIADIGSTGTTREQLHFEIRYQGQPVDPLKHLPKR